MQRQTECNGTALTLTRAILKSGERRALQHKEAEAQLNGETIAVGEEFYPARVRGVSAIIPDYLHRKAMRTGKHNIRSRLSSVNR